jgi:hypothetical protein
MPAIAAGLPNIRELRLTSGTDAEPAVARIGGLVVISVNGCA